MARQPEPSRDETPVEIRSPVETYWQSPMREDRAHEVRPSPSRTAQHNEKPVTDKPPFDSPPEPAADPRASQEDGASLVELMHKLGTTLDRHRQWSARRAAEQASRASQAAPIPQGFEAAPADDAAEAMAAYFGKSAAVPQAASPNGPVAAPADGGASNSATSNRPAKPDTDEFVRIEEPEPEPGLAPPTVLFPGQRPRQATAPRQTPAAPAPGPRAFDPPADQAENRPAPRAPSNDDNERALREALMNLQRMGK